MHHCRSKCGKIIGKRKGKKKKNESVTAVRFVPLTTFFKIRIIAFFTNKQCKKMNSHVVKNLKLIVIEILATYFYSYYIGN